MKPALAFACLMVVLGMGAGEVATDAMEIAYAAREAALAAVGEL